jgi:hypothetical protein
MQILFLWVRQGRAATKAQKGRLAGGLRSVRRPLAYLVNM